MKIDFILEDKIANNILTVKVKDIFIYREI